MRKGFVDVIILGVVALVATIGLTWWGKQYQSQMLGATIATTSISDTIGTFRTNVNTSLENINNQLGSISSTVSGLGTLSTVNSPTPVANGGTGTSTSPSNGQYLGASGTTPTWKAFVGVGLTVTSTPTSTIFTTQGIDINASYTWNGLHTFTAGVSSTATTTLGGNVIFQGLSSGVIVGLGGSVATSVPAGASGSYLASNGSNWVATSSLSGGAINKQFLQWDKGSSNITDTYTEFVTSTHALSMPDAADSYLNSTIKLGVGQTIATATIKFSSASGGNTNYRMTVDWLGFPDGSGSSPAVDDTTGATIVTNGNAACGNAGFFCEWNLATSSFDGLVGGRSYLIRLLRQGAHASDTSAGTASTIGIELSFR